MTERGRPAYTPSKEEMTKLKELFEQGGTVKEISQYLGINPSTFYALAARDEDFSNEVSRSKALYKQSIRRSLSSLLKDGNPQVTIHLSKSVLKNIEAQKIEAVVDIGNLSDEELEEAVKRILAKETNNATGDPNTDL